jgi:oxygen tolerance protein BatD
MTPAINKALSYSLFALALLLCGNAVLVAQNVSFTASSSSTSVAEGQQFQVTYTLSGGELRSHSEFRQSKLNDNFLTLMGPSTSQQMSIINGKVSASMSWTYVLQSRQRGTFTIPPASIKYDGKVLKSNSLKISVVKGSQQQGGSSQQQKQESDPSVNLGDDLMLLAIPDKKEVFQGEPVRVSYKLYSRVDFQLENVIKIPRSVGFWSEELEAPRQLQQKIEVRNGKQYRTFLVRKVAYFPTQTGTLYIEPFEIGSIVQVRVKRKSGKNWRDQFFSDPFFDSFKNVRHTISSRKLAIKVKPVPEEGKPESFKGAVGKYTLDVSIDRTDAKANETIALTVTIRGTGNLKLLSEPDLKVPTGIDQYDPNIVEDFSPQSGTLSGKKSFEYILIPRYPGQITIPPVEFSYFDFNKNEYVTLESDEYRLQIEEGESLSEENLPHSERIKYRSLDINPLKSGVTDLQRKGEAAISVPSMIMMYGIPVFLALVGIGWKRRHDRIHGDVVGLRMRRANRTAEKHLAASKKYLNQNMTDKYYEEVARALWGYIQHKLNIPTSETSVASVLTALEAREVASTTIDDTKSALDGIEFARFSPTRSSLEEMGGLYDKARTAIISIEQELRG